VAQAPEHVIENLKLEQKKQAGKKVVKKNPPAKGYVHWDRATFERLCSRPPEPLESRFQVTHGMLLYLLQAEAQTSARDTAGPQGYARLVLMVRRSHGNEGSKRIHLRTAAACCPPLARGRASSSTCAATNTWRHISRWADTSSPTSPSTTRSRSGC